jgi:2-iminobutanoate/2-iminopropanoate deaminase
MKYISTKKAPTALGPYSQAVSHGNFVFCSGMIGIDPKTGKLVSQSPQDQTVQIFKNIIEVLKEENLTLNNIVKSTIFLKNMDDFKLLNNIYGENFIDHKPARSTVEVSKLPLNALIEIEFIAMKP